MNLSIITINYNNVNGLKRTFETVLSQNFQDFEYIVIDGGSTDGSKALIEKFADKISYYVSEPDAGIYDAMNKGISKASNAYLLFLNSGDVFCNVEVLQNCDLKNKKKDILYADIFNVYANEKVLRKYDMKIGFEFMFQGTFCHNATFIKRDLFTKFGLYNLKYKIVSDWHFFMKVLFKNNCTYQHLDFPLIEYDRNGFSSLPQNQFMLENERNEILNSEYAHEMGLYQEMLAERRKFLNLINSPLIKQISIVKIAISKFINVRR